MEICERDLNGLAETGASAAQTDVGDEVPVERLRLRVVCSGNLNLCVKNQEENS